MAETAHLSPEVRVELEGLIVAALTSRSHERFADDYLAAVNASSAADAALWRRFYGLFGTDDPVSSSPEAADTDSPVPAVGDAGAGVGAAR